MVWRYVSICKAPLLMQWMFCCFHVALSCLWFVRVQQQFRWLIRCRACM